MKSLSLALKFHSQMIKNGLFSTVFFNNQLIDVYSKRGLLRDARRLFDEMPEKNVFSWNAIIVGYVKNNNLIEARSLFNSATEKDSVSYNSLISGYVERECHQQALELFAQMQGSGVPMDDFTATSILNLAARMSIVDLGKQIHACMLKTSNDANCFGNSSLIDMYSKCGCFMDAFQVFGHMGERDVVSKNAVVAACCREGDLGLAFNIFREDMDLNDTVSWNTLIFGYANNGCAEMALELFTFMAKSGIEMNEHTFTSVLSACLTLKSLRHGKEVHACVLKNGLSLNLYVGGAIVDVYCKCDDLNCAKLFHDTIQIENNYATASLILGHACLDSMIEARKLFDSLVQKSFVVWAALLSGYIRTSQWIDALDLFREFRLQECWVPDALVLINAISACAIQSALSHGKQIHAYLLRVGIDIEEKLGSALVDMYSKSGEIDYSKEIFMRVKDKDCVLCNAIMGGFAHHGRANDTIEVFELMLQNGTGPDKITFIALLSACRHAGLVEEGEKYFDSMVKDHGIAPELDHYSCMINLLGRTGHLDKARSVIARMEVEPDAIIWGTLLNSCKARDAGLCREAEGNLLRMEESNGARYVQLANAYAAEGEWREMGRIRKAMRWMEAKKHVGCSWVYVENKLKTFVSNDRLHPEAEATCAILGFLNAEMREGGHFPVLGA